MKLPIPNRKDWTILFILFSGIFIVYLSGAEERTHPDEYVIKFNSPLQQPDHITCGPTSAAMILHHYDIRVSPDEVKKHSKTVWFAQNGKDVGMTSPDYLPIAMNKFGLPATMKYGDLDVLKHYVAKDKPCIVLVRSGESLWHYVVVYGFTPEKLNIADPGSGTLYEMTEKTFIGCWSWATDMDGITCGNTYLCTLLRAIEVYPYTFICPDKSPN
jgi:hypothetical protein